MIIDNYAPLEVSSLAVSLKAFRTALTSSFALLLSGSSEFGGCTRSTNSTTTERKTVLGDHSKPLKSFYLDTDHTTTNLAFLTHIRMEYRSHKYESGSRLGMALRERDADSEMATYLGSIFEPVNADHPANLQFKLIL